MPAAGTDPAYIPGLTAPSPAEAEGTALEQAAEHPPEDVAPYAPDTRDVPPEADELEDVTEESAADAKEESGTETGDESGGPVFEVSDRRASITADRTGITFRLDSEMAEFSWDEVRAVEIDTPRFGRLFTVTVYISTRRWYEAEIEASARRLLKEWTAELDAVLDVYFEDSEKSEEPHNSKESKESKDQGAEL